MNNSLYVFDEIRTYHDNEVNSAIRYLIDDPEFAVFIRYLFRGVDRNELINSIKDISTIAEFQDKFVKAAMEAIIKRSIDELSYSGVEQLEKDKVYLFLSNHRDIVLDSSLINYALYMHGFTTSQVAIGGNLLISPMITHMVKLNKSFIVKRNIPPRELYNNSKLLSSYISHTLFETRESVWIAQREGRAKDGNDKTQYSLLKMLCINDDDKDLAGVFQRINVFPVTVSYELDPCDVLKAIELYSIANKIPYVKTHQTDFQSMITGMQGFKGRVEVGFSSLLTDDELKNIDEHQPNNWLKKLAAIIDNRIFSSYRLWETNYIAYDLLSDKAMFHDKYTEQAKETFINYLREKTDKLEAIYPKEEINKIILNMYANPVKNKLLNNLPL